MDLKVLALGLFVGSGILWVMLRYLARYSYPIVLPIILKGAAWLGHGANFLINIVEKKDKKLGQIFRKQAIEIIKKSYPKIIEQLENDPDYDPNIKIK